jgi:hypothetical protein
VVEQVLTMTVFVLVGARLVQGLRLSRIGDERHMVRTVYHSIRWRHLWPIPFVLSGVGVVSGSLLQIRPLAWGWWNLLGGSGTPFLGVSNETTGTVWEWLIPVAFIALLLPALPMWANAEERLFRSGAEAWSTRRRVVKTVQFGLVHALVGIPIGVAIALTIGGGYFMIVYLRRFRSTSDRHEATLESTRAHTAYNAVILTLVVILIVVGATTG